MPVVRQVDLVRADRVDEQALPVLTQARHANPGPGEQLFRQRACDGGSFHELDHGDIHALGVWSGRPQHLGGQVRKRLERERRQYQRAGEVQRRHPLSSLALGQERVPALGRFAEHRDQRCPDSAGVHASG